METVKTKELAEVLGLSRKGVIEKARKDEKITKTKRYPSH